MAKNDETLVILSVVTVISISILFSILTNYGLENITGLDIGTVEGTVGEPSTTIGIVVDAAYKTVNFGFLYGGQTSDTTTFDGINDPKPILVRNDGTELIDVQIQATPLWSTGISSDYQFSVDIPDPILFTDANLGAGSDNCGTDVIINNNCFSGTLSATTPTNLPTGPLPPPMPANAIDNLRPNDANDEARVNIHINVPIGEQAGTKTSTVTLTGVFSNTIQ